MTAVSIIIQTILISVTITVFIKTVSFLRRLIINAAIKIRVNHNKKYGLPEQNGVGEIDSTSLSYQVDSAEGWTLAVLLFLLGSLYTLIPLESNILFSICASSITITAFLYSWFMRASGTRIYRILVYISCLITLFLTVHIIVSLFLNIVILIHYNNSIHIMMYTWTNIVMYKLLLVGK